MHKTFFFVKRPKFLATTLNLRAEQNLVHLGRFMHFSQKVVGVTLTANDRFHRFHRNVKMIEDVQPTRNLKICTRRLQQLKEKTYLQKSSAFHCSC